MLSVSNTPNKDKWVMCDLVKVIDGDTISVIMNVGTHPLLIKVRIAGIDCPESSRRSTKNEKEIIAGKCVTEYTKTLLKKKVKVRLTDVGKYGGRWIGDVMIKKDVTLSSHLLEMGYAKPYTGKGAKGCWTDQELDTMIR